MFILSENIGVLTARGGGGGSGLFWGRGGLVGGRMMDGWGCVLGCSVLTVLGSECGLVDWELRGWGWSAWLDGAI